MDEVNEQQELAKEIADAIANPLGGMDSSIDDEELEKELEDLEQEELDRALLRVNGIEQTEEPAGAQHETSGGAGASSSSSYPATNPGTQLDSQKDEGTFLYIIFSSMSLSVKYFHFLKLSLLHFLISSS